MKNTKMMKLKHFQLSRLLLIAMISMIAFGQYSCKSQKKIAAEQAAEEKARKIAKAKADLETVLADTDIQNYETNEKIVSNIKSMEIDDPEVQELITRAEVKVKKDRERALAIERQEHMREQQKVQDEQLKKDAEQKDLNYYFQQIASSDNLANANRLVSEALDLFASDDVPVLIIISKSGDMVDYDKPTTIRKYLEYLKDQKVNRNVIENVVYNDSGKIKELELLKK